jgi:hypothetical protein
MNSPGHFADHFFRRLSLVGLLACICRSVATPTTRAQELYDFNPVASDLAREIEKALVGSTHSTVLVTDFTETHDPDSPLAVVLAQNFSHSLRSHALYFTVLDHSGVEAAMADHKLPIGALASRSIVACYAPELGATLIVSGQIEYTPENIILDLDFQFLAEGGGISGKRIITPLTLAMETLKSKPAVGTLAIFGEDKTVWVRDESSKTTIPSAVSRATATFIPLACIVQPLNLPMRP